MGSEGAGYMSESLGWSGELSLSLSLLDEGDAVLVGLFLRLRRGDLGRLLVRLELVELMKLELATLKSEVGRARRILWDLGTLPAGGLSCLDPGPPLPMEDS